MPRTQTDARERILDVADQLFYREGVRATGIDTIIARSEVAKTTLYRYFPSKDDLVVAYLERRNQQYWDLLEAVVDQYSGKPKQQLLAVFGWLDALIASPENHGCPFLMTASEFPEVNYPGHQVAIAHKQRMGDRLVDLAEAAGIKPATELSAALLMLIDGAFAQRRVFQKHGNGVTLEKAAAMILQIHLDFKGIDPDVRFEQS
jgi:AcrR family transcriptional regulator